MSPPQPPLPPSGPPNSMYFSRRKPTTPSPPSPERTNILHWSRNFMAGLLPNHHGLSQTKMGAAAPMIGTRGRPRRLLGCQCRRWDDGNMDLVVRFATEFHRAID